MKKFFLIFILHILFFPYYGFAEDLIIVMSDYPPYEDEKDGYAWGLDVEIIQEVCKKMEMSPRFKLMSWKRCLRSVTDGSAHAILSLFRNDERERFLHFPSEPVHMERNAVFILKSDKSTVNKMNDLDGKSVGILPDISYGTSFDNFKGINRIFLREDKEQVKALDKGRVDAVVADEISFIYLIEKFGLSNKFKVAYIISEEPAYMAFSKKSLAEEAVYLSEKFDKAIQYLKEEGTIQKILNKYQLQ